MTIRRGEVYYVDLDPVVGHEQRGRRPVVVVSNDALNARPLVVMVVPGTSRFRSPMAYASNVRVPAGEAGLTANTEFQTFQARALDHSRFAGAPCGVLGQTYLGQIEQALAWTFALSPGPSAVP